MRRRIESLTLAITVRAIPQIVGPLLQTNLTFQQFKILTSLVVAEGATTSELARTFEVSMATMSKLVDRLVAQGLVNRTEDPTDRRVRRVLASDLGRTVVAELLGARPELGNDILEGLSVEELRALETGMRAIHRELQALDR